MKKLACLLLAAFAAFSQPIFAQSPVAGQQWIDAGNVRALVRNNGILVSDFRVPTPADSLASCLGELSLWAGGIDPAGNLKLAVQQPDTAKSNFRGGFRVVPGSAKVWKITRADVEQHEADWLDNGQIDNPNPAIFAWPGIGNAAAEQFNGFSLDSVPAWMSAPFWDKNENRQYDPAMGEIPRVDVQVNEGQWNWSELLFAPFHEKMESDSSPANRPKIGIEGDVLLFTYRCEDSPFLSNTVFGRVHLHYRIAEPIDSFFVGFLVDGNVGDPTDDFLGHRTAHRTTYFYDAKPADDLVFGQQPPIFGFRGDRVVENLVIPDSQGGDSIVSFTHPPNSLIPMHPENAPLPPPMQPPTEDLEFYNYLTGTWRTGVPLTTGGNGYTTDPSVPTAKFAFPGFPGAPGEWSEITANNPPGDRHGLLGYGARKIFGCGAQNCYDEKIGFSLYHVPGGEELAAQVGMLDSFARLEDQFFYWDFFPPAVSPFAGLSCLQPVLPTLETRPTPSVRIFPNPASDVLNFDFGAEKPAAVRLFDAWGRQVFAAKNPGNTLAVPVGGLPAGVYFLHWQMQNGWAGTARAVVARR